MKIPDNYRQLKPDEIIRKGDLYQLTYDKFVHPVKRSVGLAVRDFSRQAYTFYRRRHTKKAVVVHPSPSRAANVTKPQAKNVTIVSFEYNYKPRLVQLISMDAKYIVGLEITRNYDGPKKHKYQFKRFLINKIGNHGTIQLEHFGPAQ